jgi:hypothetical protein
VSVPALVAGLRSETGCSRATAYRAVADALAQGVLERAWSSQDVGRFRGSVPDTNRETASLRRFRYLTIPTDERDRVHVVRETVQCGKPRCRCARGAKHGPYFYLRYESLDADVGMTRYAREYVPKRELARVPRWVRRHRAATTAFGWGQAGLLRRILERRLTDRRLTSLTEGSRRVSRVD